MALADLTAVGLVTVVGANGKVTYTGITSSDLIDATLTDTNTLIEQRNGLGNPVALAMIDQRDEMNISFYPLPTATNPADTDYRALTLPALGSTVTITALAAASGSPAGVMVNRIGVITTGNKYTYTGGGTITQTSEGLIRFNLPCRRYYAITPA